MFTLYLYKMKDMIDHLESKLIRGGKITDEEAYALHVYVENGDDATRESLYEASHRLTRHFCGNVFDTCSIINCKSGNCSEDCKWCAQSAHYTTSAERYTLLPSEVSVAQAIYNRKQGVGRFSLVGSGKRPTNSELDRIADTFRKINESTDIKCCASLGLCTEDQLQKLYDAGVGTYHCNMESSPSHFGKLCSTHTQADKEATIRAARRVGMRVCSGGIIGMGETSKQRVELALYLRSLDVLSIPINVLQPIAGTPLGDNAPLTLDEVFTCIALFRFIQPSAFLRFAGGRSQLSDEAQRRAIYVGINSAITGDLLTTPGEQVRHDMVMISDAGLENTNRYDWPA